MKRISRRGELASILSTILIAMTGIALIESKLKEQPSTSEDLILTPEEIRSLPPDTIPVVILRELKAYDSKSLPYLVLSLVLERSGAKYALGYSSAIIDSPTSLHYLASSIEPSPSNPAGLTIGLYGAIEASQPGVKRIDIPAAGGLLGLRVLCVNRRHQERFSKLQDLTELKPYVAVQGVGWGDADVLRSNGLQTYEIDPRSYLSLIDQDRVDYLPRSLTSVEEECGPKARDLAYRNIALDGHLLLAYPNAWTFAINQQNTALYEAITRGFERAYADGSLKKLLQDNFFSPWLKKHLDLPNRRLLVLASPQTSAVRKAIPQQFWFVPWDAIDSGAVQSGKDLCKRNFFMPLC